MEEIKKYFLTNNKSGCKTNEKWLLKNEPELYYLIINHTQNQIISFKERVYLYINNIATAPICPQCGKCVKFIGTLKKGYSKYCSIKCLNQSQEHKNKIIDGCIIKHGCESYNQAAEVKKNKVDAFRMKFGVDNPMQNSDIQLKHAQSLQNNNEVANPMFIPEIINNRKLSVASGLEFNIVRMLKRIDFEKYTYIKHDDNVHFHCNVCNKNFEINSNLLTSRLANKTNICTKCNKIKSYSKIQESIENYLISLNINFETKNRKLLKGKELDIYIPEHKLAIEIDGIFWHSDKYKDEEYHLRKTIQCEKLGIILLHIFEDEWIYKENFVKNIIKNKIDNKVLFSDDTLTLDRRFYSHLEFNNYKLINTTKPYHYEIKSNKTGKRLSVLGDNKVLRIYDCGDIILAKI